MVACFFGKTGHVATVKQRCAVNSEWYTTISSEKFEKRTMLAMAMISVPFLPAKLVM